MPWYVHQAIIFFLCLSICGQRNLLLKRRCFRTPEGRENGLNCLAMNCRGFSTETRSSSAPSTSPVPWSPPHSAQGFLNRSYLSGSQILRIKPLPDLKTGAYGYHILNCNPNGFQGMLWLLEPGVGHLPWPHGLQLQPHPAALSLVHFCTLHPAVPSVVHFFFPWRIGRGMGMLEKPRVSDSSVWNSEVGGRGWAEVQVWSSCQFVKADIHACPCQSHMNHAHFSLETR